MVEHDEVNHGRQQDVVGLWSVVSVEGCDVDVGVASMGPSGSTAVEVAEKSAGGLEHLDGFLGSHFRRPSVHGSIVTQATDYGRLRRIGVPTVG